MVIEYINDSHTKTLTFINKLEKSKPFKMSDTEHLSRGSIKPVFPDDGILRLYSMRFCPYAHRVHLVLDAKKIPHHKIYINLRDKPDWFANVSATTKVPALELVTEAPTGAGTPPILIESLFICDYLDEKYPEISLHPKDPLKKAEDRILVDRFGQFINAIYKLLLHDDPAQVGDADLYDGLDIYEKELKRRGTPFFGGSQPGMLDYMIWPWCERFAALKYTLGKDVKLDPVRFKILLQWEELMLKDPAVKSFFLDGEVHAKYMKSRRDGNADYNML
ncbi:pyrimidodiazepine synthase isoform X2 [Drosophila tropicalis]